MCSPMLTENGEGRFLIISVTVGCEPANRLWYVDLEALPRAQGALDFSPFDRQRGAQAQALPIVKLIDDFDAQWEVLANEGTTFTLMTNLQAPRYRCTGSVERKPCPTHSRYGAEARGCDAALLAVALQAAASILWCMCVPDVL